MILAARLHAESLHRYLWRKSDDGFLEFYSSDIAEPLDVPCSRLSETLLDMVKKGRVARIKLQYESVKDPVTGRPKGTRPLAVYQISDPDRWRKDDEETWARLGPPRRRGRPSWG